ncbi:alpha/beta hydrolase family protein [Neorhizobium petrolearium]|uniref:alpha/beta hydrolase family protein n=1 Tax=Neorhizobium petrolearium TaxID=515361 RepID=UPI003F159096
MSASTLFARTASSQTGSTGAGYADDMAARPAFSVAPVVLPAPERLVDLELRISAPVTGTDLPIILLSHGHGPSNFLSSLRGYGPLADFWAGQGFVVIQPTHLDSATLPFRGSDNPEAPLFWRSRAQDMTFILDNLDVLEEMVPQIRGQLDREKIAIAGHSMGGYTASLLLGARTIDPVSGAEVNLFEPRFKAGVIMSAPGLGGTAVSKNAIEHYPVFSGTDFSNLVTPSLVAYGTADNDPTQHLTVRGSDWYKDPYLHSQGRKVLLGLLGAGHSLGGVSGYDAKEADDENPEMVEVVQWLTLGFLRQQLLGDDAVWNTARAHLDGMVNPLGQIETK